jgi:hypothetical protein
MNSEQKSHYNLRKKQDKDIKKYNNFKNIHNHNETEWVAKAATYKKPPKRLPHNKDVFV